MLLRVFPDLGRESKSGAILTWVDGDRLVATKVDGTYWMYWGVPEVYLATSPDLIHWELLRDDAGRPRRSRRRCCRIPTYGIRVEPSGERYTFGTYKVDDDFLETYGMEVAAGRWFSEDHATDSTATIVNEAAVRQLGFADPQEAIGTRFRDPDGHP